MSKKGRMVNTVTASFTTITRQMTEMPQRKKQTQPPPCLYPDAFLAWLPHATETVARAIAFGLHPRPGLGRRRFEEASVFRRRWHHLGQATRHREVAGEVSSGNFAFAGTRTGGLFAWRHPASAIICLNLDTIVVLAATRNSATNSRLQVTLFSRYDWNILTLPTRLALDFVLIIAPCFLHTVNLGNLDWCGMVAVCCQ